jgi:hypothetical protein
MTREKAIIKAKEDLMNHRAFWWFINDLQEVLGPEINVTQQVGVLLKLYAEQLKNEKPKKYKQGEIPL